MTSDVQIECKETTAVHLLSARLVMTYDTLTLSSSEHISTFAMTPYVIAALGQDTYSRHMKLHMPAIMAEVL